MQQLNDVLSALFVSWLRHGSSCGLSKESSCHKISIQFFLPEENKPLLLYRNEKCLPFQILLTRFSLGLGDAPHFMPIPKPTSDPLAGKLHTQIGESQSRFQHETFGESTSIIFALSSMTTCFIGSYFSGREKSPSSAQGSGGHSQCYSIPMLGDCAWDLQGNTWWCWWDGVFMWH